MHRTQPRLGGSSMLGRWCDTATTSRQALLATFCAAWGSGRVFCRGRLSAMVESPFPSRELTGWPGANSSSPHRQSRWCYTRAPSQAGDFYGVQQSLDYFGGTPVASGHHHTPHSSIMTHGLGQHTYRHRFCYMRGILAQETCRDGCGMTTGREETLTCGGTGHHDMLLPYPSHFPQNLLLELAAAWAVRAFCFELLR